MSVLGEREALWDALLVANPIAVTDRLPNASLRQRNAYFSSSDAAFRDRYQASAEWERVRTGGVAVDGGWRIYSSGPGLYAYILVQHVFGLRRRFGEADFEPRLPESERALSSAWHSSEAQSEGASRGPLAVSVPRAFAGRPAKEPVEGDRQQRRSPACDRRSLRVGVDIGALEEGLAEDRPRSLSRPSADSRSIGASGADSLCVRGLARRQSLEPLLRHSSWRGRSGRVCVSPGRGAVRTLDLRRLRQGSADGRLSRSTFTVPPTPPPCWKPGRIAALGHAPIRLPAGESVTVDFGRVRSPLGAFIEWGERLWNRLLGASLRRRRELSRGRPHRNRRRRQRQLLVALDHQPLFSSDGARGQLAGRRDHQRAQAAHPEQGSHADRPVGAGGPRRARRPLPAVSPRTPGLLDRAGGIRSGRGGAVRRIRQSRAAARVRPDHALASAGRRPARGAGEPRDQPISGRGLAAHSERRLVRAGRRTADDGAGSQQAKRWSSIASPIGATSGSRERSSSPCARCRSIRTGSTAATP